MKTDREKSYVWSWVLCAFLTNTKIESKDFFIQKDVIFVQLDKLGKLDRATHAWIGFNYSLKEAQKTF